MIKVLRGHINRPIVLWVLFLLLLFFLIAKPGIGFPDSSPKGLIRSALVEINGKTRNAVLVTERRFEVTESTTILDLNRKNIDLDDLSIPCLANIKYRLIMDQDPVILKIVVEEKFPNSSTVFIPLK